MIEHQHPPKLDVRHAAQSSAHLSGHDLLANYERLMHETQGLGSENTLNWSAQAGLRADQAGLAGDWLHLTVATTLPLVCQRCLGQVDVLVQVAQDFRFVASEAIAEQQDDEADEDLLVTSRDFDLAGLIEDEVLLALPLVPRHDTCPVAVILAVADADFQEAPEKPNPFAQLAQLKGQTPG